MYKNYPMIDMKGTGKRIKELRKQNDLSVRELQRLLGLVSPQSIYKWQRGETLPNVDNLVALANIFEVKLDDILIMCEASGYP